MDLVERERKNLEPLSYAFATEPKSDALSIHDECFAAEHRAAWRVNRAIRQRIETGTWPEMNGEIRYFLWHRLRWAEQSLDWVIWPELQTGEKPDRGMAEARWIEWLLIWGWDLIGRDLWLATEEVALWRKQAAQKAEDRDDPSGAGP